ncbi:SPFH domain-containing protein [Tannockella kyphosi]|uniref:SPFH domain-containing protein n=1 Tax=Tannockella kyphosi TaxID=2899121 RepID=UPI00201130E7|nr:SPFH domain-containing protein [Tannockella kyphosi]
MGLIKAATSALSTTLADQWKEYFVCDSISNDTLLVKGVKKSSSSSSNTKGSDNVITNGSVVSVADGQCMLIVAQGKIMEVCAEPGAFTYDTSTEPSIFAGSLGTSIIESFKTLGNRFTFGGEIPNDQRVYYINTKELTGNKYGTMNPIPFRVVDKNIGLDVDISIRCNGEYSYKITNPLLFYTNVVGNVTTEYKRSQIDSMLKTELLTALQPAFGKISEMGIRYSALPNHAEEMATVLNDLLSEKWKELRGLEIVSFGVNSATASQEDEAMITELQKTAVYRDPTLAAAMLAQAQAEALKSAAANEGQGAFMAFAGMNMAQSASGGASPQSLFAMGQQQQDAPTQPAPVGVASAPVDGWTCECGTVNTGKFCVECGKPKPAGGWTCECGTVNAGKFCTECGKPATVKIVCDKCGWTPKDGEPAPKFCPECGDVIDGNDKK